MKKMSLNPILYLKVSSRSLATMSPVEVRQNSSRNPSSVEARILIAKSICTGAEVITFAVLWEILSTLTSLIFRIWGGCLCVITHPREVCARNLPLFQKKLRIFRKVAYLINEGIPQDDNIFYCNFFFWKVKEFNIP